MGSFFARFLQAPPSFWAVAVFALVCVLLLLLRPLLRQSRARGGADPGQVYRAQLKALEGELERGLIEPAQYDTTRAEIARRLLAHKGAAETGPGPRGASRALALALVLGLGGGGLGLYGFLGQPGLPDQPLAARRALPDQATLEARLPAPVDPVVDARDAQLLDRLRATLAQNPEAQGYLLLANSMKSLRNFPEAHAAQGQALALLGDEARAAQHTDWAELMVFAAGGMVSREAKAALEVALEADPKDPRARYYIGVALAQTGQPQAALSEWAGILRDAPPGAGYSVQLLRDMRSLAEQAGLELAPQFAAPKLPALDAETVAAAQEMSDEDRQQMIGGMVARLEERLATEGGTPPDWARLIRALRVTGEETRAAAIAAEAQGKFAQSPEAVELIRQALEESLQ